MMSFEVFNEGQQIFGEFDAHGFRFSAISILNESGEFKLDVIEVQLAHLDGPRLTEFITGPVIGKSGYE